MKVLQTQIHQFNKKCAEFLGCTFTIQSLFEHTEDRETVFYEEFSKPSWWNSSYNHRYGFLSYQRADYMLYDSDWNWIMEVIEKINDFQFGEDDISLDGINLKLLIHARVGKSTKFSVIDAIDQFINWYNLNKNKL